MTRVIKDVLRVGRWKVGFDESGQAVFWNVTPQVLGALEVTTKARLTSGDAINYGKTHGDDELIVPPDELIAPLDDVMVKDGVLWASSYVTPTQADYLANPARKVSVGVLEDYTAGDGQRYPLALAHVAVTDRPVVTGQGKFLALANSSFQTQGNTKMDFAALVEALNALLTSADLGTLPDDVDETNLVMAIKVMASANGGGVTPKEPAAAGGEGSDGAGDAAADAMAGMSNGGQRLGLANRNGITLAQLSNAIRTEVKPLTDKIAALEAEKIGNAKADYIAFETELGKAGVTAVTLTNKRKIAEKLGWDKGVLDGLHPTITMSNRAKANASSDAPDVPGAVKLATDDEVEARIKARGGDTSKMPRFSV